MLYTVFPQLDLACTNVELKLRPKIVLYCVSSVGPCSYNAELKLRPKLFYSVFPQLDFACTNVELKLRPKIA